MAETILRDIGSYKNKIITALLQNDDVMECMLGKNYTAEQVDGIVYKQVFPYLYVDNTQTETKSYIGIEIDPSINNRTIKTGKIVIWIYSHKDIMKYSKSGFTGTRSDILSDMVERVMRELNLGIGKTGLESAKYFIPNSNYYGRVLVYNIPDFKIKDK
jgi:hypothetical protein